MDTYIFFIFVSLPGKRPLLSVAGHLGRGILPVVPGVDIVLSSMILPDKIDRLDR